MGDHRIVLQDFAADVQRQVFGVDYAAQEPEPCGHQVFGLIGNEHLFHVEPNAVLATGIEKIERFGRRNEQQVAVFQLALHMPVDRQPGLVESADMAIEFRILLVRDVFFGRVHRAEASLMDSSPSSAAMTIGSAMWSE